MGNKIKDKAGPPLWEHRPICGGLPFLRIRPRLDFRLVVRKDRSRSNDTQKKEELALSINFNEYMRISSKEVKNMVT